MHYHFNKKCDKLMSLLYMRFLLQIKIYSSYFKLHVLRLGKFVPDEFVTRLPPFCNSNYLEFIKNFG